MRCRRGGLSAAQCNEAELRAWGGAETVIGCGGEALRGTRGRVYRPRGATHLHPAAGCYCWVPDCSDEPLECPPCVSSDLGASQGLARAVSVRHFRSPLLSLGRMRDLEVEDVFFAENGDEAVENARGGR